MEPLLSSSIKKDKIRGVDNPLSNRIETVLNLHDGTMERQRLVEYFVMLNETPKSVHQALGRMESRNEIEERMHTIYLKKPRSLMSGWLVARVAALGASGTTTALSFLLAPSSPMPLLSGVVLVILLTYILLD